VRSLVSTEEYKIKFEEVNLSRTDIRYDGFTEFLAA
jgi:hypothetical protein